MDKFEVGDRVRYTGKFLHDTMQVVGGEAGKVWTVVVCNCYSCDSRQTVAVDEESSINFDDDGFHPRHIHRGNLIKKGQPDYSNM